MGGKARDGRRLPLLEAQQVAAALVTEMRGAAAVTRIAVAGSVRRGKSDVGDIDLVVIRGPNYDGWLAKRDGSGGSDKSTLLVNDVQVDILSTDMDGWGAALMHATGSKGRNIGQRKLAAAAGFKLSEKGLFKDGVRLSCSGDERAIYDYMGWTWREPKDR